MPLDEDADLDIDDLLSGLDDAPDPSPQPSAAETEGPPPVPEPEPTPVVHALETDELPVIPSETPSAPDPVMVTPSLASESDEGEVPDFEIEKRNNVKTVTYPWMKYHHFTLVDSVDMVRQIVDAALAHGRCSLDLETEGLDNRIDYDGKGQPHTRHKVVGYCISVRGHGYYVPIRHKFDLLHDPGDPNLPADQVDVEIRRLCRASQPVLTEEGLREDPQASTKWVTPPRVIIYFWNAKFDQEFLYPITGIDFWHPDSFEDGYLAAYVFYTDDPALGLKPKANERLVVNGHPYTMIDLKELFPKGTRKGDLDFSRLYPGLDENVVPYGCSDAVCTEILCEQEEVDWDFKEKPESFEYKNVLGPTLNDKRFRTTYRLEKQAVQPVRTMERSRTLLDKEAAKEILKEAEGEKLEYLERIQKIAEGKGFRNFNPGSPIQLSAFLFGSDGLDLPNKPPKSEKSGIYKTDAATLEGLVDNDPDAPQILLDIVKFRQVDKVIGTYLLSLTKNTDEHNQLRFNFKQTGAATGRFTAPQGQPEHGFAGVPIHGIPGKVDPKRPKCANSLRRLFIAHPGYTMIKIDYAGQELRVVTNVSGEPLWTKEFLEGSGDLHTLTAKAFFGDHITKANKLERTAGKIANFSLIYGGGVQAIQRATKCDQHEAARKKKAFDASVPVFAKWVKRQHEFVKKHLGVYTGFRRFVRIPDANIQVGDTTDRGQLVTDEKMARRIRAGCERKSTNYPIQGSGADILKIVFIRLYKELYKRGWLKHEGDDSVRMLMTVHDEIVFEVRDDRVPEALPVLVDVMESPSRLAKWKVPLIVEPLLGKSWDAKYDWLEILAGKAEMPEWLVPHFEAYEKNGGTPATRPVPKAMEAEAVPQSVPLPGSPPTATQASETVEKEVAVFTIHPQYLTRQSIRIVMKIIDGAIPLGSDPVDETVYKRLRLVDPEGNILIPLGLGIRVDPEAFSQGLQDHNLGTGEYHLEGNP